MTERGLFYGDILGVSAQTTAEDPVFRAVFGGWRGGYDNTRELKAKDKGGTDEMCIVLVFSSGPVGSEI
jgi:hypothetical protein